jgi:hypothetical protein
MSFKREVSLLIGKTARVPSGFHSIEGEKIKKLGIIVEIWDIHKYSRDRDLRETTEYSTYELLLLLPCDELWLNG